LNNTTGWFLSKLYSRASLIAKEERSGPIECKAGWASELFGYFWKELQLHRWREM